MAGVKASISSVLNTFRTPPAVRSVYYGSDSGVWEYRLPNVSDVLAQTAAELWRTQPFLRTVVDFLARNVAQLGLHTFERSGDNDRSRIKTGPVVALFGMPNPTTTQYELIRALVSDLALYDNAYWLIGTTKDVANPYRLETLPAQWVQGYRRSDAFTISHYVMQNPDTGEDVVIPANQVLHFHGWDPDRRHMGTSAVETLKLILAEQIEAQQYRQQLWKRGGRVGAVLTRPAGAPDWSKESRDTFREDWNNNWTGRYGPKAGGTPILEDGMELKRIGFSAKEDDYVNAAKLALNIVASVYHVNPTMLGLLDNANYSNVREFRRMLYGDTLGPILAMIEDRINTFLVPLVAASSNYFVEFNVMEKLQGSFEEQASVMSTMVGRPIMTANEGRQRFNLPRIEDQGADELITPLNVTVGGQPSPQTPVPSGGAAGREPLWTWARPNPMLKAAAPTVVDQWEKDAEGVFTEFYRRQRAVVLPKFGAAVSARSARTKDFPAWWNSSLWNRELTDKLYALAKQIAPQIAHDLLLGRGIQTPADLTATLAALRKEMQYRAELVNTTTYNNLYDAMNEVEGAMTATEVFDAAIDTRATANGLMLVTALISLTSSKVAKTQNPQQAKKTWVVTSSNPRPAHAALDGQVVGVDEKFSNGAAWPGDLILGVDGIAGCRCRIDVEF